MEEVDPDGGLVGVADLVVYPRAIEQQCTVELFLVVAGDVDESIRVLEVDVLNNVIMPHRRVLGIIVTVPLAVGTFSAVNSLPELITISPVIVIGCCVEANFIGNEHGIAIGIAEGGVVRMGIVVGHVHPDPGVSLVPVANFPLFESALVIVESHGVGVVGRKVVRDAILVVILASGVDDVVPIQEEEVIARTVIGHATLGDEGIRDRVLVTDVVVDPEALGIVVAEVVGVGVVAWEVDTRVGDGDEVEQDEVDVFLALNRGVLIGIAWALVGRAVIRNRGPCHFDVVADVVAGPGAIGGEVTEVVFGGVVGREPDDGGGVGVGVLAATVNNRGGVPRVVPIVAVVVVLVYKGTRNSYLAADFKRKERVIPKILAVLPEAVKPEVTHVDFLGGFVQGVVTMPSFVVEPT